MTIDWGKSRSSELLDNRNQRALRQVWLNVQVVFRNQLRLPSISQVLYA